MWLNHLFWPNNDCDPRDEVEPHRLARHLYIPYTHPPILAYTRVSPIMSMKCYVKSLTSCISLSWPSIMMFGSRFLFESNFHLHLRQNWKQMSYLHQFVSTCWKSWSVGEKNTYNKNNNRFLRTRSLWKSNDEGNEAQLFSINEACLRTHLLFP